MDENHAPFTHTHTHFAAYPPHTRNPLNTRRLQLQYNLTLPGHTEMGHITHQVISLRNKIVLVMMPRSWETLPEQCALPQVLHELQAEWVFGSDGLNKEEEIDLDGPTPVNYFLFSWFFICLRVTNKNHLSVDAPILKRFLIRCSTH